MLDDVPSLMKYLNVIGFIYVSFFL
jgi:hypothetical protein